MNRTRVQGLPSLGHKAALRNPHRAAHSLERFVKQERSIEARLPFASGCMQANAGLRLKDAENAEMAE